MLACTCVRPAYIMEIRGLEGHSRIGKNNRTSRRQPIEIRTSENKIISFYYDRQSHLIYLNYGSLIHVLLIN